jgi:hypothetical protein
MRDYFTADRRIAFRNSISGRRDEVSHPLRCECVDD